MPRLNLKNKLLLLRTKLFIFFWTRNFNRAVFLKKLNELYHTHLLGLWCRITTHVWGLPKVVWEKAVVKHRTCSLCRKREYYESILSTEIRKS